MKYQQNILGMAYNYTINIMELFFQKIKIQEDDGGN